MKQKIFYCKIYQQQDNFVDYIPKLYINEHGVKYNNKILLQPAATSFGPYITLPAGIYNMEIDVGEIKFTEKIPIRVTSQSRHRVLMKRELVGGYNLLIIELMEITER